jgi:hypothetical protein
MGVCPGNSCGVAFVALAQALGNYETILCVRLRRSHFFESRSSEGEDRPRIMPI